MSISQLSKDVISFAGVPYMAGRTSWPRVRMSALWSGPEIPTTLRRQDRTLLQVRIHHHVTTLHHWQQRQRLCC
jgi:hypothetical protein